MYKRNCGCHWVSKVLILLVWLSAFGFWWVSWKGGMILGMNAEHLFRDVVILTLLAFSTKFCGCCQSGRSGCGDGVCGKMDSKMCSHDEGCKCGDCGKCC